MQLPFSSVKSDTVRQIHPVTTAEFDTWRQVQPAHIQDWLEVMAIGAAPLGKVIAMPPRDGFAAIFLIGVSDASDLWSWGCISDLPSGLYELPSTLSPQMMQTAVLGWGLASYRFDQYKKNDKLPAILYLPKDAHTLLKTQIEATYLTRDLINMPALDMGPEELAAQTKKLATEFDAQVSVIVGTDLIHRKFPLIHAVGMASTRAPRLIDLIWTPQNLTEDTLPKVTLVGKGVCFDSGGLDLKPSSAMLRMKKDMGGAAQVLGLAYMIMARKLPIRLRVLIPAVENSVAGNALRPMDILTSRSGKTIEIGNTDAEGRVILADALSLASEEKPDMILDFATLTGAARVAVGTELPAFFCNDNHFANDIITACDAVGDPVWRMPLFERYRKMIASKNADLTNSPASPYAGAITAALFLEAFIDRDIIWGHFDLMAYNLADAQGKIEGGEAQAVRGVFKMLQDRYK